MREEVIKLLVDFTEYGRQASALSECCSLPADGPTLVLFQPPLVTFGFSNCTK